MLQLIKEKLVQRITFQPSLPSALSASPQKGTTGPPRFSGLSAR